MPSRSTSPPCRCGWNRARRRQIYKETWRWERDFFYDPNIHGVDIPALTAKFEPYLDGLVSRGDLTYLLGDMLGEITAQHIYLGGGERPQPKRVPGGLLGADYTVENDRYRFKKIYHGENWNPQLRAPLTEPGVKVLEGTTSGRERQAAHRQGRDLSLLRADRRQYA